jgi:uncharacterized protein YecE (DUF72 family)
MILIGTSGWQYGHWRGAFYPKGLPQRRWLEHYVARFPVVEVNNSFYRLPEGSTFARWHKDSPRNFVWVVKASRYITHIRRLRDCREPVKLFWSRARALRAKLGPVLFQFPPNFQADVPLLKEFLGVLPKAMRPAFEFRDRSWERDEVLALLDGRGAAWVLADRPGARLPDVSTGGWSYIRFHQGRRGHPGYSRAKLRTWAERIAALRASDVFAFFNNDAMAAAPGDAETLMDLLRRLGQDVAEPETVARGRSA